MLIKSIQFKNFRCYQDAKFDFSTNDTKNITVIVGDNTSGKTTIIKGIQWCLYKANLFKNPFLLNLNVSESMDFNSSETVQVSLVLEHLDNEYTIITSENYSKNSMGVVISNGDPRTQIKRRNLKTGKTEPISFSDSVKTEINSILPADLAEYFFLEGESIAKLTQKNNLSISVSKILGLERYKEAIGYFTKDNSNSVYNKIHNELKGSGNDDFNSLDFRRNELINEIETTKNSIENAEMDKDKYEREAASLKDQIDAMKGIEAYQQALKDNESKRKILKPRIPQTFNSFIDMINRNSAITKYLLSYAYSKNEIKAKLKTSTIVSEKSGISNIHENAIDDLIRRGRCLCGAIIEKGNDAYKHLEEERKYIAPHDYGKQVKDYIEATDNNHYFSSSYRDSLKDVIKRAINDIESFDALEEEFKELDQKVAGTQDVAELHNRYTQCAVAIARLESNISYQKNKLQNELQPKLSALEKKIEAVASENKANLKTMQYLAYCDYIADQLKRHYDNTRKNAKVLLQTKVQELYDSMFSGKRKILIDDHFNVSTIDAYTKKSLDESGGSETVKNFAFIGGLTSLAKEKALSKLSDDMLDDDCESYPLVLDAPFSATDENHIAASAKILPSTANQCIFVLMEKDYKIASPYISNQIGAMYRISIQEGKNTIIEKEEL